LLHLQHVNFTLYFDLGCSSNSANGFVTLLISANACRDAQGNETLCHYSSAAIQQVG
jgi:hypothetical protein